jgi:hypothetical protein
MRAADLDDIGKGPRLGIERCDQPVERGQQRIARRQRGGDMQRGGKAVVRALRAVYVVVGMNRLLAAARARQRFIGDPGDHFVDVHIGLRAAARLENGQRELVVILACPDRGGGTLDRLGERCPQPVLAVDPRSRLFHRGLRVDDLDRHALVRGEGEVGQAALRLRAPIGVGRDFDGADGIGFGARLGHGLSLSG